MLAKPVALALLKQEIVQPVSNRGGKDNIRKGDSGLP